MTQQLPNARFWVYVNGGPVKLTLRPGEELSWSFACRTDEGWHAEGHKWEYPEQECFDDEPTVYREWWEDGTDCDGRLSISGEDECVVGRLMSGNEPFLYPDYDDMEAWAGVRWPEWVNPKSRQRDYSAEAMGY